MGDAVDFFPMSLVHLRRAIWSEFVV